MQRSYQTTFHKSWNKSASTGIPASRASRSLDLPNNQRIWVLLIPVTRHPKETALPVSSLTTKDYHSPSYAHLLPCLGASSWTDETGSVIRLPQPITDLTLTRTWFRASASDVKYGICQK